MKIKICWDSTANIHSKNDTGWVDPVEFLGLDEGEWEKLSDEEKGKLSEETADQHIDIWYEEQP